MQSRNKEMGSAEILDISSFFSGIYMAVGVAQWQSTSLACVRP
jgi:hypothetical protein